MKINLIPLLLLPCFFSCSLPVSQTGIDRSPSGACWEVNLSNGFQGEAEITSLYQCLNQRGSFDAFSGLVESLKEKDREGIALGDNLAMALNESQNTDLNPVALIQVAAELIEESPTVIENLQYLTLELIYGSVNPSSSIDPHIGENSILLPAWDMFYHQSRVLLDNPGSMDTVVSLFNDPRFEKLFCTLQRLESSSATQDYIHRLLPNIGKSLELVKNENNDRWTASSGHSLKDWLFALTDGDDGPPPYRELFEKIHPLIADQSLQTPIAEAIRIHEQQGDLSRLGESLLYLSSVDKDGGSLSLGERSALYRIIRLMDQSNQSLECQFSIIGIPITAISIDNLAVEILDRL
ncbi:MAG: hypothetical protein VX278_16055, partial [Myxococcota bacterium]|nr:hypothetical protein [Myxococcota bacterium]